MNSKFHFPTLLGLAILLTGLVAGVMLTTQPQNLLLKASQSPEPKNIKVVNVTAGQATIYWQTDQPATGFIEAGKTARLGTVFKDERDGNLPENHHLHFITLKNLEPNTTYYYKVKSGTLIFPSDQPFSFQTSSILNPSQNQPVIGLVLDKNMQPVTEALIILEIPNAQTMAAISKVSGNFVLPLVDLKNNNLSQILDLSQTAVSGDLSVIGSDSSAKVKIELPKDSTLSAPIILGREVNLITQPTPIPEPILDLSVYDLNHDGLINNLDQNILRTNFGKKPKEPAADLNQDGVVDQKDLDLLKQFITPTPSRR